ncbi:MAG TPA: pseudouridine synthase [Chitinophagaceae bacterium]|nr:pseudouridine synthase [Chitinophagaceae bacterium]
MSKNQQFQKFITYKSNAAKKESFKQEKRLAKKERAAAIDKRFEEKRLKKSGAPVDDLPPAPQKKAAKSIERPVVKQTAVPASAAPAVPTDKAKPGSPSKKKTAVKTPKPGSLEEKKLLAAQASGQPTAARPAAQSQPVAGSKPVVAKPATDSMPLNKYVAHAGICSRRDAADLIRQGEVRVNDVVVTEPGTKVSSRDNISFKGKKITPSKNLVYILLNKPKDYITTLDDPEGRKTVLDLIRPATTERVYPVGRLDRNTSGVLLITNDGDLAQTLSHPKNLIKKIYEVRLDRALTKADFDKLLHGITLEDGFIAPDALGYTDPKDKTIIGIEIHSGRNRIVRRVFEYLGYDVRNLDRVMYAGLTKKNVQRGKWRFLTEKEVRILRHFNPQTKTDKVKKPAPAATQQATKH